MATQDLTQAGTPTFAGVLSANYQADSSYYIINTDNTSGTKSFNATAVLTDTTPASEDATVSFYGLRNGAEILSYLYTGSLHYTSVRSNNFQIASETGSSVTLERTTTINTPNIIGRDVYYGVDSAAGSAAYADIYAKIISPTAGSYAGSLEYWVAENATPTKYMELNGSTTSIQLYKNTFVSGNVVIGSTSPGAEKLSIFAGKIQLENDYGIQFFDVAAAATAYIKMNVSDALELSNSSGPISVKDSDFGFGTQAPNSTVEVNGSFSVKRVASAVTVSTSNEVIIGITDTSVSRTINLQSADALDGRIFILKDESGAAGTNNIIVNAAGGTTIDGLASTSITTNYGSMRVYSDGTNFFTF